MSYYFCSLTYLFLMHISERREQSGQEEWELLDIFNGIELEDNQ